MNKVWIVLLLLLSASIGNSAYADESDFASWLFSFAHKGEVAPLANETYKEECGSCHFPYQPGLLPTGSWQKLLAASALEDHFGENAELDEDTRLQLLAILEKGAADKSYYKRSRKIMASLKGDTPLRITEIPYIRRKHDEIPARLIKPNDKVKSLSYCNACHQQAARGNYDDDTVSIPGYGNWTW
jgi:hypothetical protein